MTTKPDGLSPLPPPASPPEIPTQEEKGWISWGLRAIWKPVAATADLIGRISTKPTPDPNQEQFHEFPEEIQDMTDEECRTLLHSNEGTSPELVPLTEEEKKTLLSSQDDTLEFHNVRDTPAIVIGDLTKEDELFIQSCREKQQKEGVALTAADSEKPQTWIWTDLAGRITKAAFVCGTAAIGLYFLGGLGVAAAPVVSGVVKNGICYPNETLGEIVSQTILQNGTYVREQATEAAGSTVLSTLGPYIPVFGLLHSLYQLSQKVNKGTVSNLAISGLACFVPLSAPARIALSLVPPVIENFPKAIPFVPAALQGAGVPVQQTLAAGTQATSPYIAAAANWLNTMLSGYPEALVTLAREQAVGPFHEKLAEWTTAYGPQIEQYAPGLLTLATAAGAVISTHPHLATLTLTAIGVVLAYHNILKPAMTASNSDKSFEIYEDKIECELGTFKVKVPGPRNLSKEDKKALIESFVQEMLLKTDLYMQPGDRMDFAISPNNKTEWTATVKPKIPREGKKEDFEKRYKIPDEVSLEKFDVLHRVMAQGAHASIVLKDLRSIAEGSKAPLLTAANYAPVGLKGGSFPFTAAMHTLLSIPETREKMKNSRHPLLSAIATDYEMKMKNPRQKQEIHLKELEESFKQLGRWQRLRQYVPLLSTELPKMETVEESMAAIFQVIGKEGKELEIPKPAAPQELQALVNDQIPNDHFTEIPPFLNVKLPNPQQETISDLPFELHLEWTKVDANVEPRNLPLGRRDEIPPPNYRLHSFIGENQEIYQETFQKIDTSLLRFYWKISGNGDRVKIDSEDFKKAAKTSTNLTYLKESEIPARYSDPAYDPTYTKEITPTTKAEFKFNSKVEQALPTNSVDQLEAAVKDEIQSAIAEGKKELILPVPLGDDSDPNWPMAVIWQVIREHTRIGVDPFEKVTFLIPNQPQANETIEELKKRRATLISDIERAEGIYQNNSTQQIDQFYRAWKKRGWLWG